MYQGRCWLEAEHLARLRRSLRELDFAAVDLTGSGIGLRDDRESGIVEGTVYIQITRGVAPRSHPFPGPPVAPTEVIVVQP